MVDLQDDQPKCCEIQEIFSELWKYTTYVCKKKLTLFLCVSLFFKQCIVVRYDPHTRLAKILLLFVVKMTKLNCMKRFLPWEFYFLDRHDVSSNIAFLVLWCIRSVYYRIWKKIGYPKLEFWVLGIESAKKWDIQ